MKPLYPAIMLLAFSQTAHAVFLSPADRDSIEQQQQQLLRQNQQQRESLERAVPVPRTTLPSASDATKGPCFIINRVVLDGSTLINLRQQQSLFASWQGQCLDMSRIQQLTDAVSDWYISRGYITSRAFLVEQDLRHGALHLAVLEGRLQKITLEGASGHELKMTFSGLEGNILNLRDIEQGMEQINRTRATPVQIEILPGDKQGWSIVQLTATPEFPLSASVSFDNSGQKSTGTGQINAGLTGNNLLGLADRWFVSGGRSSAFSDSKDAQNFAAGVSVPYGYTLFDYSYSWNNYLSTIDNHGWLWRSSGDTETHRVNVSHVLFRNGDIKTGVSAGLSYRINHNYLDDVLLKSSSRKLSVLLFGINHTQKIAGGVATLNPTLSRGMPWFGAERDGTKNGDLPKAQFRKWSLSASFQRPVAENLWWLSSFYGQWSPDRLYGSERLTLGGESSVRGFKEQYISGDNGGYWRNELNYLLFTLPGIGQVSALAALDGGWLHADRLDPYASGTLWGTAAGLSTANRWLTTSLTAGIPLAYPDWLGPDHLNIYYRVAVAF
ncbi:TPA: ShlB/FhaC/HecB family hemolysin secretion/activation protein [Klebsiella aerogenes]|uniref:Hemolysin secretion/activation protein, ShlB/FhaC/HecB family n=1 Tax=Klebsiella aerogenes (strain ATCC 13048 / DSM 30053 / CCUG 1429 / JCM 1235 / KCTC 2190 / NBRC 13534 / NCIMB 10102 / NCTC 10006 / CDC 819-56) TaxID=1028307 RepID=A0A0H3FV92_KLEAK|nr:ShlB/FhaC/HecB family hemolysin secretion/activation protein [Klebsiella aerogenes]AEG96729.1 hemolysin secretion/activation protein, ShlB/FhaC/HecB family [Klebsiella aerogenes KCTC 2190]MEC4756945.1 ShlB/FhaC/HecB family hemolysin secretion/activation protein [Klebsiella aerogenes]QEU20378.1 ShlB/FhaC/HecB family hemolysin secretion/activation protein [Klebsiella aerogenes]QXB10457.1 ShlB/FhaC/HecB family hemolysin secretion/activation protein [Klebsiella aerogenes]RFP72571.1 ShlB/FhaC/He